LERQRLLQRLDSLLREASALHGNAEIVACLGIGRLQLNGPGEDVDGIHLAMGFAIGSAQVEMGFVVVAVLLAGAFEELYGGGVVVALEGFKPRFPI
jgi:hypothetical protein